MIIYIPDAVYQDMKDGKITGDEAVNEIKKYASLSPSNISSPSSCVRARSKNNTNNIIIIKKEIDIKKERPKMDVPVFADVLAEFLRLQSSEDEAQAFYDYYQSNGWRVGKNKMVNWKSAVSAWIRRLKIWAQEQKTKTYVSTPGNLKPTDEEAKQNANFF